MLSYWWLRRLAVAAMAVGGMAAAPATIHAGWVTSIEASNPLNWMPFEETSGDTFADQGSAPLVGKADPGANGPVLGVDGLVGKAVQFNGQFDRIVLNGGPVGGDWTAEFILKKTGSTPTSSKLIRGAPFVYPGSALELDQYPLTHQVGFTEFGAANYLFQPGYTAPVDEFVHLVFRRSAEGMSLFVNGELKGTGNPPVDLPRFQIGDDSGESILSVLDEMVLYNRALSKAEINSHHNAIAEPNTLLGDTNGDQVVNLTDFSVLKSNFGRTWSSFGDANLDGIVDDKDIAALKVDYGKPVGGDNDLNGDGRVDIGDFVTLKQGMGTRLGVAIGDLNGDGAVNISDFGVLKEQFGAKGAAAVPEPATVFTAVEAALLAGLLWLRRR
jgi:hypothetical protein